MTQEAAAHVDLTMAQAAKGLTGFEVIGIEDRFRTSMDAMSGIRMTIGLVWAYRRRGVVDKKSAVTWADVEKMTVQELEDFFEAEPDGLDEDAEGNVETA